MTAEAPKGRKRPKHAYSDEVRQAAFKVWLDYDKPQWRALEVIFAKETGQTIHYTTLHAWSETMPEWQTAIAEAERKKPMTILAALDAAKKNANKLEADHFVGIKAQLVGRLFISVQDMALSNITDWTMALDCLEKVEAHIHAERGKAVAEKGPNVVSSLMERLSPNVSIAPFKKPAAPGAN